MVAFENQESSMSTSSREKSVYGDYKRTERVQKRDRGRNYPSGKVYKPREGSNESIFFNCLKSPYGVKSIQFHSESKLSKLLLIHE